MLMAGCGSSSARSAGSGTAPQFTLKDIKGNEVSLESALKENKAVLVNFWATWCPPCREEIPDLIKLQKKYEGKDFTILGLDVGESAAKVGAFGAKAGINYPLLLDSEQSVAEQYGVVGIPTSYLIASDGKLLGEYHSYNTALGRDVEKALQA